jgi:hypothetical protein
MAGGVEQRPERRSDRVGDGAGLLHVEQEREYALGIAVVQIGREIRQYLPLITWIRQLISIDDQAPAVGAILFEQRMLTFEPVPGLGVGSARSGTGGNPARPAEIPWTICGSVVDHKNRAPTFCGMIKVCGTRNLFYRAR